MQRYPHSYSSYPSFTPHYAPAQQKNTHQKGASSLWIGAVVGAVLLAAPILLAIGLALYVEAAGLVLPGVTVASVPLAWMDRNQAAEKLNRIWNEEKTLTISDGVHAWAASPAFFGLWLDPNATAEAAYSAGRSNGGLVGLVGALAKDHGMAVEPVVNLNAAFAEAQLSRWAKQINQPAQDTTLVLEGETVKVLPGANGSAVNVRETMLRLLANPALILQSGQMPLIIDPVPPRVTDVAAAQAQVEGLLSHTLHLGAYDPITDERLDWTAPRAMVATWLKVENGPEGPQVLLDAQKIQEYAQSQTSQPTGDIILGPLPDAGALATAVELDQPVILTVRHKPTQYKVQSGDTLLKIGWKVGMPYWRVIKANPGLTTDTPLGAGRTLVIPSKDDLLPLPVVPNKRIVISISQQRMWLKEDGKVIHEYVISTGIDRSPTQPGIFQVQTHETNAYAAVWDLTMPHFLGIYEAWPGFMNGIHGLPTLSNGVRLWSSILGKPASYGCIILNLEPAAIVYSWAENGTVVEIVQ